jgi:hypothetical protein
MPRRLLNFSLGEPLALPVVYTSCPEQAAALTQLTFLRARGHGAVVCALEEVPAPAQQLVVREFELDDNAVSGIDDRNRPFRLPYAQTRLLVRVSCVSAAVSTHTTQSKKFDMSRALLSGGLMMRKTVEKTHSEASTSQQQVLYAFGSDIGEPLVWKEQALRYQGLGAEMQTTSMLSFAKLVEGLRRRAPAALYDDRLLTQKRRQNVSSFTGSDKARRIEHSNERENMVAAYLLALAQRQDQL